MYTHIRMHACTNAHICTHMHLTNRSSVYEYNNEKDKDDSHDPTDDVPLVELPNDVLEGLERRSEPEEGGGRAAEKREGREGREGRGVCQWLPCM